MTGLNSLSSTYFYFSLTNTIQQIQCQGGALATRTSKVQLYLQIHPKKNKEMKMRIWYLFCQAGAIFLWGSFGLMSGGCVQTRITEPKRAAVEQLLLSTAADRALVQADFSLYLRKKVYVDTTYFDSYDKEYVIGSLRDALSIAGALLVDSKDASDAVIELRSGALSMDGSESLIGLPSIPVPVPLVGTMQTPEISLYKTQREFGVAKLAVLGYWTKSRQHAQSTGPLVGKSYMKYFTLLGYIKYTSTDIPEKLRSQAESAAGATSE